jgi:hypothetical protein
MKKVAMKRYLVELTEEERAELLRRTTTGRVLARKLTLARILLKADDGLTDTALQGVRLALALDVAA